MKLSNLLTAVSVLGLAFGLAFLLIPHQMIAVYGLSLDPQLEYLPRYLGSAFIGLAAINWFARDTRDVNVQRVVVLGDLVLSVTGLCVAVLNAVFRPGNGLVWSTVVIYGLMTAAFAYFQWGKRLTSRRHGPPLAH